MNGGYRSLFTETGWEGTDVRCSTAKSTMQIVNLKSWAAGLKDPGTYQADISLHFQGIPVELPPTHPPTYQLAFRNEKIKV